MDAMKAVRIHRYGGPDVLEYEDAPRPTLLPDDVLVRVHAAGVNPVDWKVRAGQFKSSTQYMLPLILGWDVSGVVEAAGTGVKDDLVGQEVYARPDSTRNGAYAEYIAVRESEVAPKPALLDHVHAAGVPLAGLTAWQALFDVAGLAEGQTVLIHGATGGVGSFAVQFAKAKGAHVIGTASAANHALLRELGADEVIDYTRQRFEDLVKDADVVLDTVGGETQDRSWDILKPGGTLVSTVGRPSEEVARARGVRGASLTMQPNCEQLMEIACLIDSGKVKSIVQNVFALEEARKAHELGEEGHTRGKIVLRVVC